jgi:hypothetical protein
MLRERAHTRHFERLVVVCRRGDHSKPRAPVP